MPYFQEAFKKKISDIDVSFVIIKFEVISTSPFLLFIS